MVADLKDLTSDELLKKLGSDYEKGLSEDEEKKRLEQYGYNQFTEKKQNFVLLFLKKFYGPVQLLLWLIIVISFLLKHMHTFYIVIALLIFNAVVGFFEEYKADKSVDALKSRLSPTARVKHSGSWVVVPTNIIVPGDIIRIRLGDIVPADAKVIEGNSLEIDESILNGESLPKDKAKDDILYEGSIVKRGEGTAIVFGTGYNTFYGRTAKLVQHAKPKSHLETAIMGIVKYLIAGDIAIILVMFGYGVLVLHTAIAVLLPFLLVMFIASVPVALSAAFTVSMALGTQKLAAKSILVTKLEAIEETSNMDVLCMDKTGTLTMNKITVKDTYPYKCGVSDILRYAYDSSREEDNDPIDNAVIEYCKLKKINPDKQESFLPFDPSLKRTEAVIDKGGKRYRITKGAAHVIIALSNNISAADLDSYKKKLLEFANSGFRTIAVATNDDLESKDANNWSFKGFIALYDPPRKDSKELIKELHSLGVSTKMITGDNIAVATQISTQLGIGNSILDLTTSEKEGNKKDLEEMIEKANGFADVYPEDKYQIVRSLQNYKHIVGMTGDGVNDAPALKQAEVGIAVSNATDVAKSAAALVLTKNGIEVITNAIKESRRIFRRMITYSMVKISKVFQIIGFIAIIYIVLHYIAISPFLLVLLIFTNDIVNIAISTDNENYSSSPNAWNVRSIMSISMVIGFLLIAQSLLLLPVEFDLLHLTVLQFETATFIMFDISDNFMVYNIRSKRPFWKARPSNTLILSSVFGIGLGLVLALTGTFMAAIPLEMAGFIIAFAIIFLFVIDAAKYRLFEHLGV